MVQGAGRPGQPNIFGAGGGPKFAQMPTYTPVTRGPGEAPQADPQTPYPPQTANPQQPAPAQPAPGQPAPQAMPPQPAAYQQPQQPQPQQPQPQPPQAQPQPHDFGGSQPVQPQAYTAPSPAGAPGGQELPDLSDADPAFPDSIFGDFKAPEASPTEADFAAPNPAADPGLDASFSEPVDASFPDAGFPETPAGADPALGGGEMGYGAAAYDPGAQGAPQAPMQQHPGYPPQGYHPQHPAPQAPQPQPPQAAPGEPGRALQALDPGYDQPPQIPLGGQQGMAPAPHEFVEAGGDADFMDESQLAAAPEAKGSKLMNSLKGRSAVMVASALLGAIALGGALAYAYKQSGGSGETPLVTADATPVKEAPNQPGGKEFPHKNKLIYDRLTNNDTPGTERLVPRQEDVAVPALPPATATAGLPAPVATTDLANPAQAGADGARKVNTFVVRPDGSVEAPAAAAAAGAAATAAGQAAQGAPGQAAQVAQNATGAATQAAGQAANMMPVPVPQAMPQQVAAANPAPAAAPAAPAADSKYVVQLGSSKSQTDALANFADAQQKYPSLLGTYQPVVRKTDLGAKGTWYRLQVGPMADKSAAYKLCGQLKSKGHADCLVMAQ